MTASGPLRAVLEAFGAGATTTHDLATATGLPRDVVDASVAHLFRIGRLSAERLDVGCPPTGCAGCALGRDGTVACAAADLSPYGSGPALVGFSLVRAPG